MRLSAIFALTTTAVLSLSGMVLAQASPPSAPTAPPAPAEEPSPAPGPGPGPGGRASEEQHWQQWMQQLGLTSEQQQKIVSIQSQYKPQLEQAHSALGQAMQQLQQLMVSNSASDAQIQSQHQQVETLQQQLSNTMFEQVLAIRDVLTPQQRVKAAQLLQQRHHEGMPEHMRSQQMPAGQPQ